MPRRCAKVEKREFTAARPAVIILADWKDLMAKKSRNPNFDQTLDILREHAFQVAPYEAIAGGYLVSRDDVGAVIVAQKDEAALAITPGILVRGELARLLDRGYQKFIKTSKFELPASAAQLHAIHAFSEELRLLTGEIDLYNEALGTTSDVYQYDRLKGREAAPKPAALPWTEADGH
jgi:hypothetical protein